MGQDLMGQGLLLDVVVGFSGEGFNGVMFNGGSGG